jgi:uncharacterized protein (DUF58 family)
LRFVFTKFFYLLAALGFVHLAFAWQRPWLAWVAFGYDVLLLMAALVDSQISELPRGFRVSRQFGGRFAMGAETEVRIQIENPSSRPVFLSLKDEYPPQMILKGEREGDVRVPAHGTAALIYALTPPRRGRFEFAYTALRFRSRLNLVWCEARGAEPVAVKVYPNMRRAREAELKALGARSVVSSHRKTSWRGEGREFESMRDYVRGDELRHISWTTTARRGKLTTRQYQIERDQTILVALDAGRLMTARIEQETKLDSAVHATLSLFSAAARAGDLPPNRGRDHIEAALESLYAVEPEMIEPSYSHAFQFISANSKRRSLVVLLTDLVDEEGSKELLTSLNLLRPRHLPLVVTIADRDLKAVVQAVPDSSRDVFTQSVAEEIIHHREAALRMVESAGGLALDVTAAALAPALLETYLRVKERGLL